MRNGVSQYFAYRRYFRDIGAKVLIDSKAARDDSVVFFRLFMQEVFQTSDLSTVSLEQFLEWVSTGKCLYPEAILRIRRHIQKHNPELRGFGYQNRQKFDPTKHKLEPVDLCPF